MLFYVCSALAIQFKDIAKVGVSTIFGEAVIPEEHAEEQQPGPAAIASMVQFDDSGDAIDLGKRAVMQAGFSERRFVQLSHRAVEARGATGRDQWQLTKMNNDGSVLLTEINKDGTLKPESVSSVGMDDFMLNYKVSLGLELDNRPPLCSCADIDKDLLLSVVYAAMYKKREAFPEAGVARIQVRPSKTVFALRTWKTGENVAMPLTCAKQLKVLDAEKDESETSTSFVATLEDAEGNTTRFAMPQMHTKEFVSLAYMFKITDKEDDANLKLAELPVAAPVFALPNCPRFQVALPVVQAAKAINCEDEMILYIPKAKKEAEMKRKAKDVVLGEDTGATKKAEKDKKAKKAKTAN
jgi:hypothetical protein